MAKAKKEKIEKPAKKEKAAKAPKAEKKTDVANVPDKPKPHKEVNYVILPAEATEHNLIGVSIIRAFINDDGDLYIKNFGTKGEQDIVLGKREKSADKKQGTYHSI